MKHDYSETTTDRSGHPIVPTCAVCGHLRERCVGEGGGGHPDYAAIGRAVVDFMVGDDEPGRRQATPERVVERLTRERDERRALETCDALRVGRLALMLGDALDKAKGGGR